MGKGVPLTPGQLPRPFGAEAPLRLELVPYASWGYNLRRLLDDADWNRLRRRVYARAGGACEICGATGQRLHCHEVWSYDFARRIQRLEGLQALCAACHEVKHFGRARRAGRAGAAIRHLRRVNGWTGSEAERHVHESMAIWRRQSAGGWRIELGEVMAPLALRAPARVAPPTRAAAAARSRRAPSG